MQQQEEILLREARERDSLARERQHLWRMLGQDRPSSEVVRMANRVETITRLLNGHSYDLGGQDSKPRQLAAGGMYEQKRHDRAKLEVKLGVHEMLLDHIGRPSRQHALDKQGIKMMKRQMRSL